MTGPLPVKKLAYFQNLLVVLRGVEPSVPHDVFYQLLVVLCQAGAGGGRRRAPDHLPPRPPASPSPLQPRRLCLRAFLPSSRHSTSRSGGQKTPAKLSKPSELSTSRRSLQIPLTAPSSVPCTPRGPVRPFHPASGWSSLRPGMCDPSRVPTASPGRARSVAARTVVGDIGHLEAFAAVAFIGFELDPELAGAGGEGDRPLVGLAGLVGGDRRGRGWGRGHAVGPHLAVLPPVGGPALPSASAPTPVPTHPSEALRLVSLPLLQEASLPAPAPPPPPPRVPTPRCWDPPWQPLSPGLSLLLKDRPHACTQGRT